MTRRIEKRTVLRAPLPRSIPSVGQIAAALAVTAISCDARALVPDAGVHKGTTRAPARDAGPPASSGAARDGGVDGARARYACEMEAKSLADDGKLLAALAKLDSCNCAPTQTSCVEVRERIETQLTTLVLVPPDHVPSASADAAATSDAGDASSISATVDGQPRAFGMPLKVDPGVHVIRFVYPDGRKVEEHVMTQAGETRSVSPSYCPYHPDVPLGGVPPPPERHRGCCARPAPTSALDLRAIATAAVAIAIASERRRRRPSR